MRPAAAVDALAAAQHREGEERAIDLVGVEPMVGARTHRDHRASLGQLRVPGELPRHPGRGSRRHGGDRLLPAPGPGTPPHPPRYGPINGAKTVGTSRPPPRRTGTPRRIASPPSVSPTS